MRVFFFFFRGQGRFLCFCVRIIAEIENLKIKLQKTKQNDLTFNNPR